MKYILYVFTFFIVAIFIATVILLIQNRSDEGLIQKLMPAIAIGVVGSFLTVWFNLKSESIESNFSSSVITHINSGKPLELTDIRYSVFYGGKSGLARTSVFRPEGQEDDMAFHYDLLFVELSQIIFSTYQGWKGKLDKDVVSSSGFPRSLPFKKRIPLDWEAFSEKLKLSPELTTLYDSLGPDQSSHVFQMTLPEDTKMTVQVDAYTRKIIFQNEFCEMTIELFRNHGFRGLGEWKWLLSYDDQLDEQFWSSTMIIQLHAKFDKLKSGHPEMPKYKEWVKTLFERIQDKFDYEKQLKSAREKYHLHKDDINTHFKRSPRQPKKIVSD